MTENSGGLFKCAAQTGRCGRNKVSRKVYVIEKMEDYKMKNRKERERVSVLRENSLQKVGGDRRGRLVYKWRLMGNTVSTELLASIKNNIFICFWPIFIFFVLFWGQRSLFKGFASFHRLIIASIFQLLLKRLFLNPGNALALKVKNRSYTLSSPKEKHFKNQRHCYIVIILFFPWKLGMTLALILR